MDEKRIVMLVDMDCFYAACEELRRPEIRGRPVIVGADPKQGKGRGVVMTCSYEARKYGIRSAMPISTAYRIKPDAVYLPMDYPYYEEVSGRVMRVLCGFADSFEQVSIDEAYLEITGTSWSFDDAYDYAMRVKQAVKEKTGLSCSVGISFNKLIAKMASDAAKPDGIKAVAEKDLHAFLDGMPVGKLYSVGEKTEEKLIGMGYRTVGELAKANKMKLMAEFGAIGMELYNYANGIDESPLLGAGSVKSIGREMTFDADTYDKAEVEQGLKRLSEEVALEAEKAGFAFRNVTVKLRYSDFSERLKSSSIKPSSGAKELCRAAIKLYRDNAEKGRKLRKVGVRVSRLIVYRGQGRLS